MNMISTGAFLNEMDASDKQKNSLVNKLVSAWEQKNSKTARAGGVSLMALSLAACGSSDDDSAVSYTQAQLDTATAAAKTAAESAAATTAAALKVTTDAAAATAATAAASDKATATAAATSAAETAAATAAAALKVTTDSTLATLQASYDALVAPKALTLTTSTDTLVGGQGNDVITGASGTAAAGDSIIDSSTTDSDTLNLVVAANSPAFTSTNVENINIDIQALTASITVDTANMSGVTNLTVSRTNPVVGGVTLNGGDNVVVSNVDVDNTPTITTGAGVVAFDATYDAATEDGVTFNIDTATGAIDINGGGGTVNAGGVTSATIDLDDEAGATNTTALILNAAAATGTINIGQAGGTTDFEGAVTVNANLAGTLAADTSGAIDINMNAATTITIDDATGGGSITAGVTSTADTTITAVNVDASGLTVTTGSGIAAGTTGKQIDVTLDGTAGTTDNATINAAGTISLDHDAGNGGVIEVLTLTGTTAEVTYDFDSPDAVTSITGSGSQVVNAILSSAVVTGSTVTGIDELTLDADGVANAADDFDSITVGKYILTADFGTDATATENELTLAVDQTVEYRINQTLVDIDVETTTDSVTIIAGDVNGATSTVGTLTLGAVVTSEGTANSATTGNTTGGTLAITANDSNLTMTSLTAWSQNVVITGDENVTTSTAGSTITAAQSVDASGLTGNLTINVEDSVTNTADVSTLTSGSGADNIDLDVATGTMTVDSGAGADTITLTSMGATATINANEGDDTIELDEDATAYVVLGGAGNDRYDFGTETSMAATIVDSSGTDDTFVIGANHDSSATALSISGLEVVETGSFNLTLSAAQFAGNKTLALESSAGTFTVNATSATAATIDATNLTMASTQTMNITLSGDSAADSITGGGEDETIDGAAGVDSLDGGQGTDTLDVSSLYNITESGTTGASTGVVVNMGSASVSGTTVYTNSADYISGGLTSVASGQAVYLFAADSTASAATVDSFTNFENVVGSTGIDYIIGDAGANTITGGLAADYLTGGSGADNFVFTSGLSTDTVSDYVAATDNLHLDHSSLTTAGAAIASTTLDLVNLDDAADIVGTTSIGLQEVADQAGTSAVAAGANNNVFALLTETYANVGAMVDGIETGDHELTVHANVAVDDAFFAVWSDGTDAYLSIVSFDSGATSAIASGELVGQNLANLGANTSIAASEFVAADFAFIA
jgi:Ca2+-binding RTX toxin-like protein